MKAAKLLFALIALVMLSYMAGAAKAPAVGTLQVFAEQEDIYISIDGNLKGKNAVVKKDIQVGEHYVKAVRGKKDGPLVFSQVVKINEGEVKTVVIPAVGDVTPSTQLMVTTTTISTTAAAAILVTPESMAEKVKLHPSDTIYHRAEAVDITGEGLVVVERLVAEQKGYRPCLKCFPAVTAETTVTISGTPETTMAPTNEAVVVKTNTLEVIPQAISTKEVSSPEATKN